MNKELKRAIINFLLDNQKEFQILNAASEAFRPYIYNEKGQYLIGGEDVHDFILDAEKFLRK